MKAIYYKEWIKTRRYALLATLVTLGFAGYCLLRIHKVASLKGAAHLWEVMLQRDAVFVELLQYVPLLAGILLAVVQFVPEMHRKCLKLTLHLPRPLWQMLFGMLSFGVLTLLLCFAANLLLMNFVLDGLLAFELKWRILLTVAPWYLAGVTGYLLAAWVCLEPAWKRRVFNLAVAVLLLRVFFLGNAPAAYVPFMPLLVVCTLAVASFAHISVTRFKEGKQD